MNGDRFHEDPEAILENGTQVEDVPPLDFPEYPPDALESSIPGKKQTKKRRKKAVDAPSSEPQQGFVAHAHGGSPPSAQPPRFNPSFDHEPLNEDEEDEEGAAVIPSSQWQPLRRESTQSLRPSQLKREPSGGGEDIDKHLQSQFAGIAAANFAEAVTDPVAAAMRDRDPENGLGWLHKRENAPQETPITDTRTACQRSVDASLPDLQPSQVKAEPDSDSPSAQRSERLSRSRSRSASRGPAGSGYLADQTVSRVLAGSLVKYPLTV